MATYRTPEPPPDPAPMAITRRPPSSPRRRRPQPAPGARRGLGYEPCLYFLDDTGHETPLVEFDQPTADDDGPAAA